MQKYKFLKHTADAKFQAFGTDIKEVFENSVLAVSEILSKGKKVKSLKIKKFTIKGKTNENLLYNLLEETIYLLDAEEFIVAKAKIKINEDSKSMKVEFHGDDSKKYKGLESVKAVTYNEMFVKKFKGKWTAQVVLDI
jgi:SHS2 domain-containing protein